MYQKASDSLGRKHSHLTTQPLSFSINICLCCCYVPGDLLRTRSSSLINLIISPYFSQSGFPGRLAISPANFPMEDHFNCSFSANNAIYLSTGIYSS